MAIKKRKTTGAQKRRSLLYKSKMHQHFSENIFLFPKFSMQNNPVMELF